MQQKEEAVTQGFLQKKNVYLRPIIRGGKMITDPTHVAYFQYEGASTWFQLPKTERGALANPFNSDEERKFFEKELDLDLNIHKKQDNFWKTFFVKVKKDFTLMHDGYKFNLADPMDNLRYRVTKLQEMVAPDWEHRYSRGEYKFALVEEGYEEEKERDSTSKLIEAYTHFGEVKGSATKMSDILGVYFMEKKEFKTVPIDADKEFLQKELGRVIKDETDLFLKIISDPKSKVKNTILQGIKAGAIEKEARNKYNIPGEGVSYTYDELVTYLSEAEEIKSDVYLKLIAQNKINK